VTSALVWLLAVVAKVDLRLFRRYGQSPLASARLKGHQECIAVLEAAGAT
jgi:hypothetical protein